MNESNGADRHTDIFYMYRDIIPYNTARSYADARGDNQRRYLSKSAIFMPLYLTTPLTVLALELCNCVWAIKTRMMALRDDVKSLTIYAIILIQNRVCMDRQTDGQMDRNPASIAWSQHAMKTMRPPPPPANRRQRLWHCILCIGACV